MSGSPQLPEWEDFSLRESEEPGRVTRGVHIGFAAHARPEVDAFWREGVALGARDDGAPGPRPQYREEYYGGFLLDPDGNSIEAAQFVLDPDGNSVELVNHNR